ncbi:MAG: class I SAM-dependent methyltransferase [Methylobacter sp.]|nr:class I SAM-dependent methyltransferase [Methylobacter sp.]MDP2429315.1 class I SAM-dependent methyltransferase [Methylobacter sp.]MDP3056275.1 class I SAM-dependent methyltransferase [Methylobacter sp.]MDP3360527.1 class I SAM-dependent methyltransferase [Methylobacter sp.]MDZ4221148.1 class I SAM-dependent methyltransferase [Methylobacter sp.]
MLNATERMTNKRISLVNAAHNLIRERLQPGDNAIDATVGNGHDTLFLAGCIAPSGHVYGFDIQQAAIDATREKFGQTPLSASLTLFHASHADMAQKIPPPLHGKINAVMFNLGYLPGSDKSVITRTDSTLGALTAASRILAVNGLITLLAYPGHPGGDTETEQVTKWCEQLDSRQFAVNTLYSSEHKDSAPRLFVMGKLR